MHPAVLQDKNGHTLVEMMVAMLILLVGLLGLIEAINIGIRVNLSNKLRNDAMNIADEQMTIQRVSAFDSIAAENKLQKARLASGFINYSISRTVTDIGANPTNKQVNISVIWRERGRRKSVSLSSVLSKE